MVNIQCVQIFKDDFSAEKCLDYIVMSPQSVVEVVMLTEKYEVLTRPFRESMEEGGFGGGRLSRLPLQIMISMKENGE